MEKRTLYGLIAFAVFGTAALFAMRAPEKGQRQGPKQRPVAVIKAADIAHIDITTAKQEKISLDKTGDKWAMKTPLAWPADAAAVKTLTDGVEKLAFADLITQDATKQGEFGVEDGKATALTLKDASGKVLADLVIGKSIGGFVIVRIAKTNDVWQETGLQEYAVNKEPKAWRDHSIMEFTAADATKLVVEAGANKLVVEKPKADPANKAADAAWKITQSTGNAPKVSDPLDNAQVTAVVNALATLKGNEFADDKKPADVGLDKPVMTVTVTVAGKPKALLFGQTVGEDTYVKAGDTDVVWALKKFALDQVGKRPVDYRDKTLVKVKADAIAEIDIITAAGPTKLTSTAGKWKAEGVEADDNKLRSLTAAFDNLQGASFADEREPSKTGLGKPSSSVTLKLKDKSTVTIKIGAESKDKSEYYVQKVGSPDIFMAKKYVIDRFLKKPSDLVRSSPPPRH